MLKNPGNPNPKKGKTPMKLWWSVHEKTFPLLSKAAKKYLAIQATSCALERTLSTGGATVSCKRT